MSFHGDLDKIPSKMRHPTAMNVPLDFWGFHARRGCAITLQEKIPMRFLFTLAIAALICSCSMQPAEVNSMSEVARITGTLPRNKATVFVHLPATIQTLNGKVSLDGRIVADLPKRSFTKLTLTPGFHTIDMKFPALTGPNCEDYKFNFERERQFTTSRLSMAPVNKRRQK
jgi:hypothetical protein